MAAQVIARGRREKHDRALDIAGFAPAVDGDAIAGFPTLAEPDNRGISLRVK